LDPVYRIPRAGFTDLHTSCSFSHKCSVLSYVENILPVSTSWQYIIVSTDSVLALRNPDHLWPEEGADVNCLAKPDIIYLEDRRERLRDSLFSKLLSSNELEKYGHRFVSSPGFYAIKNTHAARFRKIWEDVTLEAQLLDESIMEKAVWNKVLVLLAEEMKQKPFERGEVIPVREGEINWDEVRNACIVSVSDWKDEKAKEHFLRCLYFGHFFGDESGLMLNILDP